ncbi:MAG: hypothetical protein HKL90_03690 [Elusimicrobia bacterium]|nr:hypothetical protein [Elusimicrobiota bacterium]
MDMRRIIESAAVNEKIDPDEVRRFCTENGVSVSLFFDKFSEEVTSLFLNNLMSWEAGDAAINAASGFMTSTQIPILDFTWEVFLAFNAGEIAPGPAITRPLLAQALAKSKGQPCLETDEEIDDIRTGASKACMLKIVELAKQIIAGNIGVIAGSRALHVLASQKALVSDPDFDLFTGIHSESDHLPLDDVKTLWDPAAFQKKQLEVKRFEDLWRPRVIDACRRLIHRFEPRKT